MACGRWSGSAWASGPRITPTSFPGGERQRSEAVMRLLHDARKDAGMTAVVVAHDAQLASWADRVVFLRNGRVTDQTTPATGPESLLAPRDTR
jgi:predicted ABC-type transport system involved in lysophospholipase L1 biosynthesis ATPase subunit